MDLTYDEFLQYVNEEDIKFIRLAFCDVYGNTKNISVMPNMLEEIHANGMTIDSQFIPGLSELQSGYTSLHPDISTTKLLPWRPEHGKVIRMMCGLSDKDGNASPLDTRKILSDAVESAKQNGITFRFGSRMEFYLMKLDEDGNPTDVPFDNAGYMDIAPLDKGENVRREICLTLERMGINPIGSYHGCGPGQNEIDFTSADPLTAADNVETFRMVVKTIASRNGLYADFSPKPIPGRPGNGFHVNVLATKEGADDEVILRNSIAGILDHAYESTVFFNPSDLSYRRLGKDDAPLSITWATQGTGRIIKLPATNGKSSYLQMCSPDSQANPYLVNALLIHSCIDGITRNLDPEDYTKKKSFPENRKEAGKMASESEFIRSVLNESIIEAYCN